MLFDFSQALWCQSVQTLNVEFLFFSIFIFFCTISMVIAGTSLIQAGLGYNNKDKSSLEWLICLLLLLLPSFFTFFGLNFSTAKTAFMCHDLSLSTSEALCGVVTGKCFCYSISLSAT